MSKEAFLRNDLAYFYVLISIDRSILKIGRTHTRSALRERIHQTMMTHRFDVIFDLNVSFCVQFETNEQVIAVETNIKKYLDNLPREHLSGNKFASECAHPIFKRKFIGYTETYAGSRHFDIVKRLYEFDFEGRIAMNRLVEELSQKDYKIPTGPDDFSAGFQRLKPLPKNRRINIGDLRPKTRTSACATTDWIFPGYHYHAIKKLGRPIGPHQKKGIMSAH